MTSGAGATYTYNASGLRISKTVSGKKTTFTLAGGNVVADSTAKYVWGVELITNGTVYYVYNAHGDVVQLLNASGTLTKTYDYDAYGNELSRDLNDSNPFRYCGEYYDTETGFIYLRARYYDPNTGRFISVDPAHDGLNWYSYCDNNPVNYCDYTGCSMECIKKWYIGKLIEHNERTSKKLATDESFRAKCEKQAKKNYEHNKWLIDSTEYILRQKDKIFEKYKYGYSHVKRSGCEAIAVYNVLHHFGRDVSFEDVVYEFQANGTFVLGGFFGANSFSIGRILDVYSLKYEEIGLEEMTANGMYVLSFWWPDQLIIHTAAVENVNGEYTIYNYDGYYPIKYSGFDPNKYLFVCAYFLGDIQYQENNNLSYAMDLIYRNMVVLQ